MPASPSSTPTTRAVLALIGIALAGTVLTACTPGDASPAPSEPTVSDGPSEPAASDDPEPTPSASTPTSGPAEMAQNLADAMSSGNTAAIEDYLTEPTHVVIAASEADMQLSAVDAVLALDYLQPGVGTWDFDLAPDVLESYAANPYYGEFFPVEAIVGLSSADGVVSFIPNGDRIGTIFMGGSGTSLAAGE